MDVLIFGTDSTNSLGLVQCLGSAGNNTYALIFGQKTGLVKSSRFCKNVFYFSEIGDCIQFLYNNHLFHNTESVPIFPSSDVAAYELNKHIDKLSSKFTFGKIKKGFPFSYSDLLNKTNQLTLAAKSGVIIPKLYKTFCLSEQELTSDKIEYPCIIKPIISKDGCKSDLRICHCYKDVKENISSLNCSNEIIIEQYIERDYEISILGCSLENGEVIMPAIEEKLTLYPKYVGLECLARIRKFQHCDLKDSLSNFVKSTGYVGLFSIEMMHNISDGQYYFTEINLRNDGANSFIYKCGVNLPLIHLYDLIGGGAEKELNFRKEIRVLYMGHSPLLKYVA